MGLDLEYSYGQTPLEEEENEALLLNHITNRNELDELAIVYKHYLVKIHPFANGNGRHYRLMADIIIEKLLGGKIFSWGGVNLSGSSLERTKYIDSIKLADKGNIQPLVKFARS